MAKYVNRVEVHQDDAGQWRWTAYAGNNEVVGASSESYHNRADAQANARGLLGTEAVPESEPDQG